jgi:hypothetical protein
MPDVFTADVVMHRPEGTLTYIGVVQTAFAKALSPHTIETTIHCVSVTLPLLKPSV